jgi:hypothetical protein
MIEVTHLNKLKLKRKISSMPRSTLILFGKSALALVIYYSIKVETWLVLLVAFCFIQEVLN